MSAACLEKPTLLLILDGWGIAPAGKGNALSLANTLTLDALQNDFPCAKLACSGRAVGLPAGFIGNSEVGHMNIGAGRVVYQDMTRIDIAVEQGEFAANSALTALFAKLHQTKGTLHLLGLLSDGGVHSHINHLIALIEAAKDANIPTCVHCFMDGRDTAPDSGLGFVRRLEEACTRLQHGVIASLTGRFYAMDRDQRWERVEHAWNVLTHSVGTRHDSAEKAVQAAYAAGETDEFITPRLICGAGEKPHCIADGDGVFFANFRADRAREITRAFCDDDFAEFDRHNVPKLCDFVCMTRYDASFTLPVAFAKEPLSEGLGELVAGMGIKQLRIAETEKYAHVTYFFNGGKEEAFAGEDRIMVPSPRNVATYDLKPEMSVFTVTEKLTAAIESGEYPFMVCNLANLDMVGHTGIMPAVIKACEAVDTCVARIVAAMQKVGGQVLLIADHGNAEQLLDENGAPYTAHSMNPVPCVLIGADKTICLKSEGKLGDVAPTLLDLWNCAKPQVMDGESLLCRKA